MEVLRDKKQPCWVHEDIRSDSEQQLEEYLPQQVLPAVSSQTVLAHVELPLLSLLLLPHPCAPPATPAATRRDCNQRGRSQPAREEKRAELRLQGTPRSAGSSGDATRTCWYQVWAQKKVAGLPRGLSATWGTPGLSKEWRPQGQSEGINYPKGQEITEEAGG